MVWKLVKKTAIFCLLFIFIVSCSDSNKEKKAEKSEIFNVYDNNNPNNWMTFKSNIEYLMTQQKFKKAIDLLNKYKQNFSDKRKEIDFLNASISFGQGKFKTAKKLFTGLQLQFPGESAYFLGHISRKNGNFSETEKYYLEAYNSLKDPEILSSLADVYYEYKKFDLSIKYYEKAIQQKPNSYIDRYLLANIYFQKNQLNKSEKLLKEALKINRAFKKAYIGLYGIADKRGNKVKSLYYQSRALLLAKKYDKVYNLLEKQPIIYKDAKLVKFYIISLFKSGLTAKAGKVITKSLKKYPTDIDLKVYQGLLYNFDKKTEKALSFFKNLYQKNPNNFNIMAPYADLLIENNQLKKGIELYEKALLVEPSNTSYRYKLSEQYRKLNQMDIELYHRGILYLYQQQIDVALEVLLKVKSPKYPDLLEYYKGMIYSKKNNNSEAIKHFHLAIEKNNKLEKAYLELAYVYIKDKNKEKALKLLNSYPLKNKEINSLKSFIKNM